MPLTLFLVPELSWYAVGDTDAVRELLAAVDAIGKKRAYGFGRVAEWTVEPWPEDLSMLRPAPDPDGDAYGGIRPPYWERRHQRRLRWPDDPRLAANAASEGVMAWQSR